MARGFRRPVTSVDRAAYGASQLAGARYADRAAMEAAANQILEADRQSQAAAGVPSGPGINSRITPEAGEKLRALGAQERAQNAAADAAKKASILARADAHEAAIPKTGGTLAGEADAAQLLGKMKARNMEMWGVPEIGSRDPDLSSKIPVAVIDNGTDYKGATRTTTLYAGPPGQAISDVEAEDGSTTDVAPVWFGGTAGHTAVNHWSPRGVAPKNAQGFNITTPDFVDQATGALLPQQHQLAIQVHGNQQAMQGLMQPQDASNGSRPQGTKYAAVGGARLSEQGPVKQFPVRTHIDESIIKKKDAEPAAEPAAEPEEPKGPTKRQKMAASQQKRIRAAADKKTEDEA